MKHTTRISGSNALRRLHCPGSFREETKLGDVDDGNEYADDGDACHKGAELLLRSNPAWAEGLTEDQTARVEAALRQFRDMVHVMPVVAHMTEVRNVLPFLDGSWGTCDVLWRGVLPNDRVAVGVVDWKFGAGVEVGARGNYQIGHYALGALHSEDPDVKAIVEGADEFWLTIIQPARYDEPDTWVADRAWFDMYEQFLIAGDRALDMPDAPLKLGPWCKYCRARMTCGKQTELADKILSTEPKEMTSVELAHVLKNAPRVRERLAQIERLAYKQAQLGTPIPGMKLVETFTNRKFRSEEEVRALAKRARLRVRDIEKRRLDTPAGIERALKAKYDKAKAAAWIAELSKHTFREMKGTTLVPSTDRRPAVETDLAESVAEMLED